MNHLCDLPSLDNNAININDEERDVLNAFKQRYESVLHLGASLPPCTDDKSNNTNGVSIAVGIVTKEGILLQHPKAFDRTLPPAPTYMISHDKLPQSGLRPLDDITLYRYLLADRQKDGTFDMELSYNRLIAALEFRKEYKSDIIVNNLVSSNVPLEVQKCQRLRIGIWAGVDHQFRPVVFERLGQFFSSGNATKTSQEEWMASYLYFLETHFAKMRESAQSNGTVVDRIAYFADFQGVVTSIFNRQIWKVIPLLKVLVKAVECHYPEIVDHIILFNVPRVASAAYNIVKGFLDPVTAEKIELHAGLPIDRFKEMMSVDVIPKEYGGKNEIAYPETSLI